MGVHLSWILNCHGTLNYSTEGACSSGRCAHSGGILSNMMQQNDAMQQWNNIKCLSVVLMVFQY